MATAAAAATAAATATAHPTSSPLERIATLSEARNIALGDATHYLNIIPGVLPIIGPTAPIELRRWGAEFLAESLACPTLLPDHKERLSLIVLETLKLYLEIPNEDSTVIKNMVQIATSIYPQVFKHTIYTPTDGVAWPQMAAIKSNILRRMDSSPPGVRICCIKFISRVIQVQTPGVIADPRRPERNDLSLALVPREHPLLSPRNLEAEALGLLDRLLNVFQEAKSDPLYVTATVNSIGILVRTRASTTSRILSAVLSFNPFKNRTGNARDKVASKSMERTVRAFLINLNKSNPNHPMAGHIQGYLDRLQQVKVDMMEDGNRKRAAPIEPTDGLDFAKRQRLGAELPEPRDEGPAMSSPLGLPLPPGPVTVAQLFTLNQDEAMRNFDVTSVPIELVNRILVPILGRIDQHRLDQAVNAVRARYLNVTQRSRTNAATEAVQNALGLVKDGQGKSEDEEQLLNILEQTSTPHSKPPDISFGPLVIPQPPPLTKEEVEEYGKGTIFRIFSAFDAAQESSTKTKQSGFTRLAAGGMDKSAWAIIIARLATRTLSGLEQGSALVKTEGAGSESRPPFSMSDMIRESLYNYVLDDFRKRIDVAITWLNEEWYNEQVQQRQSPDGVVLLNYDKWALKMLDGIVPYLDAKDKVLIRLLSEIPRLNVDMLYRVKSLAEDPERVSLAVHALHYLALYRLPVREMSIDALEDLWRNYDDARALAQKMIQRWRPHLLQQQAASETGHIETVPAAAAVTSST